MQVRFGWNLRLGCIIVVMHASSDDVSLFNTETVSIFSMMQVQRHEPYHDKLLYAYLHAHRVQSCSALPQASIHP